MIQLNSTEQKVFEDIAQSSQGEILLGYLNKLVNEAVDSRKISGNNIEAQLEARNMFAKMVDEGITSKLKNYSANKAQEGTDDFS